MWDVAGAAYPEQYGNIAPAERPQLGGFDWARVIETEGKVVGFAFCVGRRVQDVALHPNYQTARFTRPILNEVSTHIRTVGGTWEADCREDTSLALLKGLKRKGEVAIRSISPAEPIGGKARSHVSFSILGGAADVSNPDPKTMDGDQKITESEMGRELNSGSSEAPDMTPSIGTIQITVDNNGIVTLGSEHQRGLPAIWSEQIKRLERKQDELAKDPVNDRKLEEVNRQLKTERTLLRRLNPSHPDHAQALNEALSLMHGAIEYAHNAPGGHIRSLSEVGTEQRGRLTAFSMLLRDMVASIARH